jgi:hypothetical protein
VREASHIGGESRRIWLGRRVEPFGQSPREVGLAEECMEPPGAAARGFFLSRGFAPLVWLLRSLQAALSLERNGLSPFRGARAG